MLDVMIPVGRCPICTMSGYLRRRRDLQVQCTYCRSKWKRWYHMKRSKAPGDELPVVINISLRGGSSLVDAPFRFDVAHHTLVNRFLNTATATCYGLESSFITSEIVHGNYQPRPEGKKKCVELHASENHLGLEVAELTMIADRFIQTMLVFHYNLMRLLFSSHTVIENKWMRAGCLVIEAPTQTEALQICYTAAARYLGSDEDARIILEEMVFQEIGEKPPELDNLSTKELIEFIAPTPALAR